jgi:hypothetical protein
MVRASLPEEVRQVADALLKLLGSTPDVPTHIRTGIRVACAGSPRSSETRLTVALVGDAGVGRRTLVNALLGDRVLPTGTPRRGSTITIVRSAATTYAVRASVGVRAGVRRGRQREHEARCDTHGHDRHRGDLPGGARMVVGTKGLAFGAVGPCAIASGRRRRSARLDRLP